jgi:DNA-binding phage protein
MKSRSHDDATVESFRQAPELAAAYLNDVLVDGDQEELMIALRRVARNKKATAMGGLSA